MCEARKVEGGVRAGRGGISQLRNRVLFCRFTRMYIPPAEVRHGHILARQCCLDRFEACFGEETLSLSSTREFHCHSCRPSVACVEGEGGDENGG
jgi:hypothetical protein